MPPIIRLSDSIGLETNLRIVESPENTKTPPLLRYFSLTSVSLFSTFFQVNSVAARRLGVSQVSQKLVSVRQPSAAPFVPFSLKSIYPTTAMI